MQAATHSPSSPQRPEEHPQMWPDLRVSPWAVDTPPAPSAQVPGEEQLHGHESPSVRLDPAPLAHCRHREAFPSSPYAGKVCAAPSPCQTQWGGMPR